MVLKMMYSIIYPSVLSLHVSVRPIPLAVTLQPALNTLIIFELLRKLQQPLRKFWFGRVFQRFGKKMHGD